jgi:hypothetical protein
LQATDSLRDAEHVLRFPWPFSKGRPNGLHPAVNRPFVDWVIDHPVMTTVLVSGFFVSLGFVAAGVVGAVSAAVTSSVGSGLIAREIAAHRRWAKTAVEGGVAGRQRMPVGPDEVASSELARVMVSVPLVAITFNVQAGKQVNHGGSPGERAEIIAAELAMSIRVARDRLSGRRRTEQADQYPIAVFLQEAWFSGDGEVSGVEQVKVALERLLDMRLEHVDHAFSGSHEQPNERLGNGIICSEPLFSSSVVTFDLPAEFAQDSPAFPKGAVCGVTMINGTPTVLISAHQHAFWYFTEGDPTAGQLQAFYKPLDEYLGYLNKEGVSWVMGIDGNTLPVELAQLLPSASLRVCGIRGPQPERRPYGLPEFPPTDAVVVSDVLPDVTSHAFVDDGQILTGVTSDHPAILVPVVVDARAALLESEQMTIYRVGRGDIRW